MDLRISDFSSVLIRQISDRALRRKERHGIELWSGRGAGSAIGVGVLLLADLFAWRRVHQSLCAAPWVTKEIEPACHCCIFGTEARLRRVPRRKARPPVRFSVRIGFGAKPNGVWRER